MAPYTLYTFGTPNGWKAHVVLEELGVDYEVKEIDISKNVQKEEWFLKINPNGRIPAIVDHNSNELPVFETGAIMWYLCEKETAKGEQFWPKDLAKRAEVMSWLMYQMGGVGPMQGQANHFVRFAKDKIPYGIKRYVDETKRLYQVMDDHLSKHEWLAADQYTIADMANFCWVCVGPFAGVSWKAYPNLAKWVTKIYARPAVKKGLAVPSPSKFTGILDDPEAYDAMMKDANEILEKAEAAS